jgi:hypothetical protein
LILLPSPANYWIIIRHNLENPERQVRPKISHMLWKFFHNEGIGERPQFIPPSFRGSCGVVRRPSVRAKARSGTLLALTHQNSSLYCSNDSVTTQNGPQLTVFIPLIIHTAVVVGLKEWCDSK